jgi:hypothetical protein
MDKGNEEKTHSTETNVSDQLHEKENLVAFFALLIEVDKRNQENKKYD